MIAIKTVYRKSELKYNEYTGSSYVHYLESDTGFLRGIEDLCNTIGEENIISVQFWQDHGYVNSCIITYKRKEEL